MYLWELPRSSQDSPERCDLTFDVWERSLLGGLVRPKSFMASLAVLIFCISLLLFYNAAWDGLALNWLLASTLLIGIFPGIVVQVLFDELWSGPLNDC